MIEASEIEKGPIHTNKTGTIYATKFYDMKGLTVQKLFRENAKRYKDSFHLGFRPYCPNSKKRDNFKYLKYSETETMVSDFASGLRYLGNGYQEKIGIMAKNCVEYAISDYATACQSMILTPVYDSYGPIECAFIISHSEIRTIICAEDKVGFICSAVNPKNSKLRHVIVIEETCDLLKTSSESISSLMQAFPDVKLHTFNEVMKLGKANPVPDVVASPDTILTIVYTSGTTGTPKGAVLTHNNCCAALCQISTRVSSVTSGVQDVMISYLPLAHILEKVLEYIMGSMGGLIGYFSGSLEGLADDIGLLRPTIWPGVPRVFSKIYTKIQSLVAQQPFYKRWIFNFAYNSKLRNLRVGKQTPWADVVVFNTMRSVMGGRVRLICSGAAALPFYIAEFISTVFGTIIGHGYGLTECVASLSGSEATVFDEGSVGHPYINSEVCLQSIPEMSYTVHDKPHPRGEIMLRGPQVFQGYYKDAEATALALEPDGWLHTGDVGAWLPGPYSSDGVPCESLHIIDRKKNIFKLAQGEFVSADKVESLLLQHARMLKQLIVYGNSTCTSLVAFVVPDWDYLLDERHRDTTQAATWGGEVMRRYWDGEFSFLLQPHTHANTHAHTRTPSSGSVSNVKAGNPPKAYLSVDAEQQGNANANVNANANASANGSNGGSGGWTGTSDYGSSAYSPSRAHSHSPSNSQSPSHPRSNQSSPNPVSLHSVSTTHSSHGSGNGNGNGDVNGERRDQNGEADSESSSRASSSAPPTPTPTPTPAHTPASTSTLPPPLTDIRAPALLCRLFAEGRTSAADAAKAVDDVRKGGDGNGNGDVNGDGSSSSLPINVELNKYLLAEMKKVCEAHPDKIKRFEIPRGVVVCATEWCEGNGLLTPSMKIKREAVRARYKRAYDEELRRAEREVAERDRKERK